MGAHPSAPTLPRKPCPLSHVQNTVVLHCCFYIQMETIVLKCISYYKISYLPPGALNIHNVFKQTPRIKRYISGPPYQLQSWAKQLIGDEAFSFGDKQIYWPDHCTGIKCVPYYYWGWGGGWLIQLHYWFKAFFLSKFFSCH